MEEKSTIFNLQDHAKISLWEKFCLLFCKKQTAQYFGLKGEKDGELTFKTFRKKLYVIEIKDFDLMK